MGHVCVEILISPDVFSLAITALPVGPSKENYIIMVFITTPLLDSILYSS
jgi:hypothetical protein